jgi:hypothetical protein
MIPLKIINFNHMKDREQIDKIYEYVFQNVQLRFVTNADIIIWSILTTTSK